MGRKVDQMSDREVQNLKPLEKPYDRMEGNGFGVRIMGKSTAPVRTFILFARYPGSTNPTRRALGQYPVLSLKDARKKASEWRGLISQGKDPRDVQEEIRQAAKTRKEAELVRTRNSFEVVAEDFIKRHASKKRKAEVVAREIRKEFIQAWRAKPITDISKQDVVAIIDTVVDRGSPYQAHNLFGHIRTLFNWAIARGVYGIEASPCDRLKPAALIGKKQSRKRTLSDDEIRAFWMASSKDGYPFGIVYQLLLLTGSRKSEVSEAQWSEFDFQKKLWTIPAARMKAEAPHVVPLTANMISILTTLPRYNTSDLLFSATDGAKKNQRFFKSKTPP